MAFMKQYVKQEKKAGVSMTELQWDKLLRIRTYMMSGFTGQPWQTGLIGGGMQPFDELKTNGI